ncbi:hypothetical protein BH09ACT8_BH09ACT8_00430 [soil metagenome]
MYTAEGHGVVVAPDGWEAQDDGDTAVLRASGSVVLVQVYARSGRDPAPVAQRLMRATASRASARRSTADPPLLRRHAHRPDLRSDGRQAKKAIRYQQKRALDAIQSGPSRPTPGPTVTPGSAALPAATCRDL